MQERERDDPRYGKADGDTGAAVRDAASLAATAAVDVG
jgi:hypothetical protein